jgi:hypothetical protein
MFLKALSTSAFLVASVLLLPARARAECFVLTGPFVMGAPTIELVFSGRVVDIARTAELGYRATFDVDGVWKGTVPRRFDLYVWELAPESPRFEKGQRYVALANHMSDQRARAGVGLGASDIVAFTPTTCSGAVAREIESQLGPGYPPKDP